MLHIYKTNFGGSCDRYLPLVEFAYNNSYHSTIGMASYKAFYRRKYRSPVCWIKLDENSIEGPNLIKEIIEKMIMIKGRINIAFNIQTSYIDPKRKDVHFIVEDNVFLEISPMKGVIRFGKKRK